MLIIRTVAADIFPDVPIPVVGTVWGYAGILPEEMNQRIVVSNERAFTDTASNIEHIESPSPKGIGLIKACFQPGANPGGAAQRTAITQTLLRILPPGIIRCSASNVAIVQTSLSSETLGESDLYDAANAFIRPGLAVAGPPVFGPRGARRRFPRPQHPHAADGGAGA